MGGVQCGLRLLDGFDALGVLACLFEVPLGLFELGLRGVHVLREAVDLLLCVGLGGLRVGEFRLLVVEGLDGLLETAGLRVQIVDGLMEVGLLLCGLVAGTLGGVVFALGRVEVRLGSPVRVGGLIGVRFGGVVRAGGFGELGLRVGEDRGAAIGVRLRLLGLLERRLRVVERGLRLPERGLRRVVGLLGRVVGRGRVVQCGLLGVERGVRLLAGLLGVRVFACVGGGGGLRLLEHAGGGIERGLSLFGVVLRGLPRGGLLGLRLLGGVEALLGLFDGLQRVVVRVLRVVDAVEVRLHLLAVDGSVERGGVIGGVLVPVLGQELLRVGVRVQAVAIAAVGHAGGGVVGVDNVQVVADLVEQIGYCDWIS